MNNCTSQANPFQITSPESLSAGDTVALFVDVFTDFRKIIDPGHVILTGPRGSGKSMMFRYLMPDCQCMVKECKIKELDFLGIYIPLKKTSFYMTELDRLEKHAEDILNSHILATHFALNIFNEIADKSFFDEEEQTLSDVKNYYNKCFIDILSRLQGKEAEYPLGDVTSAADVFKRIAAVCEQLYAQCMAYAKKSALRKEIIPYENLLVDYYDFLYPLLKELKSLECMPQGPIYLLIDDAHVLSNMQTRVLNSWIATRTSSELSLKVSTQINYQTYYTITGSTIDTPHDYSSIDISTIYTSSKKKYRERVDTIVRKRLSNFDIKDIPPEEFFPEDKKQEEKIRRIAEKYIERYDKGEGKGYHRSDDAYRYARPDYIKSLAGTSKSSSTYSYAGFKHLVDLSSGIIRYFLNAAHQMFSETQSNNQDNKKITFIPPGIQNEIVRKDAEKFLLEDLERLEKGPENKGEEQKTPPKEDLRKLSNLLQVLGGMFRQILLQDDRAERRVFSFAISDTPSDEVLRILNLGIRLGYFHCASIGRKDRASGGRTRLYVLSRRLAPIWTLDPDGFSGYQFVTNNFIEKAIRLGPQSLLRKMEKNGIDKETEGKQMSLVFPE